MPSSPAHTVLFLRTYREAALPIYSGMVDELCGSPYLPFQLATTLEDIGQHFLRLADRSTASSSAVVSSTPRSMRT
ncbi:MULTISPECIES: hypothetical protein [unclassified Methylobacterium]|uniref:hypothetical protein n=1 Tax=unclassified Methylobacterium TaxID=2615210 RepID=UPI00226A87F2|nr:MULTISPECIES: hypothetical protein [unclassified Methylobacterium]